MFRTAYYNLKPFIPRYLQIFMRRRFVLWKRSQNNDTWPIDKRAAIPPAYWKGWPEGKQFAFVLTHDVDTVRGHERCHQLKNVEKSLGFRSSFNFVPERYSVSPKLRQELIDDGFEVGVHGLRHDGDLYKSKDIFLYHAHRINRYLEEWGAVGFRSPAMHHNLEWIHYLNVEYDASTFDTDPFEPQPDGVGTIFPFWVQEKDNEKGYVELPYTLPQDFTLFILMKEKTTDIWEEKLNWIADNGGMALLLTHPDYMNFGNRKLGLEEYSVKYYENFLNYVEEKYNGLYWHTLPKDLSRFISNILSGAL